MSLSLFWENFKGAGMGVTLAPEVRYFVTEAQSSEVIEVGRAAQRGGSAYETC